MPSSRRSRRRQTRSTWVELPRELVVELERLGLGGACERVAFLREAIRKALDEATEKRMEAAYRARPDGVEEFALDPDAWSPRARERSERRRHDSAGE